VVEGNEDAAIEVVVLVKLLQNRFIHRQFGGPAINEQHHETAVGFRVPHVSRESWPKLKSIADTKAGIQSSLLGEVFNRTCLRVIRLPITAAIGTVRLIARAFRKLA